MKTPLVNTKKFLDKINYRNQTENYNSFIQNYMDNFKQRTNYDELKTLFENCEKNVLDLFQEQIILQ